MSGIVGSYFNTRGSGVVAKLGTDGQVFTSTGAGLSQGFETAAGGGKFESYAIIEDKKTANTDGGTFESGDWRVRDLNTEVADIDGIVSIASDQFTLAAGSYLIKWYCTALKVAGHQSKLYDITGAADVAFASVEQATTANISNKSIGAARHVPSGSNVYEIRHRCTGERTGDGFGNSHNLGVESYMLVEIYKES
jgi:hypothetical protein